MLNVIQNHLDNSDNQLIIQELSKQYQLSNLEYISLIDILIYYYSISCNPNTLQIAKLTCDKITEYRSKLCINQTNDFFHDCLLTIIKNELTLDENAHKNIESFIDQGFVFHSFNASFFDKINSQGLVVNDKPWSLDDIEQVRLIFKKYGINNIFGLYQGRTATPIFFADTLITSPYYGLSSPTFFRKFIEHKKEYFNVFLNRSHERAQESITELCSCLNNEERQIVFSFFNKYWQLFTSDELPYVAISTKEKLEFETIIDKRRDGELTEEYYVRVLLSNRNNMCRSDVARDKLEIFSYDTLSFSPKTKEKNI